MKNDRMHNTILRRVISKWKMINLRKSVSPPPPCKKTCPCTILPAPFFSFSGSLPLTPPGEVIKIYFPSLFKGGGGGGGGQTMLVPSLPAKMKILLILAKKSCSALLHIDLFQLNLFPSYYIYFLFTNGHDTDTVKVQVKVLNSVGLKYKFNKAIMKVFSFWRGFS